MEVVLYSSADSDTSRKITIFHLAALVFGVTFFVIGYIGLFFGRLIKSAVSRQREFLADASAIQFTRNPDGLGNALRKIGGSSRKRPFDAHIENRNAEQLSHLFLSAARPNLMAGLFATHPPLRERLRRIYGRDVGMLDAEEVSVDGTASFPVSSDSLPEINYIASPLAEMSAGLHAASNAIAATAAQAYGTGALAQIRLCPDVDRAAHDPYTAPLLAYALLLDPGNKKSPQQQCVIEHMPQQAKKVMQLAVAIAQLPANARLPLLDLMMPALRQLPTANREAMLTQVQRIIASDHRVSLNEFVLQIVLARRLAVQANRAVRVKYFQVTELKPECHVLFSLVAHVAAPLLDQPAQSLFMRATHFSPTLHLAEINLIGIAELTYGRIQTALDKTNQLAPLANPALIKSLLAIAGEQSPLPLSLADLLRAMCAAIEAPMPAAVAAVYTASGWPDASLS